MNELHEPGRLADAAKNDVFWLAGQDCDAVFTKRSDVLLVTFDNLASIDERPETRPWPAWQSHRAEALDYSILSLQSHHKNWYRSPEPSEWLKELGGRGFFDQFAHIVFIGASMGAFAALCYAGLVPGAQVLAFSPQSTLNRSITPFEKRYPYPYRKFDWEDPEYLDAANYVANIAAGYVFYDPKVREDQLHVDRIRVPNLSYLAIPYAGHTLIRVMVKAGAFDHLLATYPRTGKLDATFFDLMKNRRANRPWVKGFLADVQAHRSLRTYEGCCKALIKRYDQQFVRKQLRQSRRAQAVED